LSPGDKSDQMPSPRKLLMSRLAAGIAGQRPLLWNQTLEEPTIDV